MKDDLLGAMGAPGAQFDPTKYDMIKCDQCGNKIFLKGSLMYNVPGISLGLGTENIPYPVPVYFCSKCGAIVKYVRDEIDKIEEKKLKNK